MEKEGKFEALANAYRNPTKFSIIVLLAEHGKMTVTQMSKYVKVSRPNLYHYVSQLVDDGILNIPESVVKKNYVEKYYSLNEELINEGSNEKWDEFITNKSPGEVRELLSSVLMGYSMILSMAAENIAHSSDSVIAKLVNKLKKGVGWTASYSLLGKGSTERIGPHVKKLQENLYEGTSDEVHESRLLLVFLPVLE